MTQQERLDNVRSALINVSNRNCNLVDLGYVINDLSLIQLQFLSLLEQCFKRIDIFSEEQINNLDNILNYVLNNIPDGEIYDTSKIPNDMKNEQIIIMAASLDDIAVLNEICKWFASYGGDTLKECEASCKDYNKSVVALYNMFNAALCAKAINQIKLYDTLMKYIIAKLEKVGFKVNITV